MDEDAGVHGHDQELVLVFGPLDRLVVDHVHGNLEVELPQGSGREVILRKLYDGGEVQDQDGTGSGYVFESRIHIGDVLIADSSSCKSAFRTDTGVGRAPGRVAVRRLIAK